MNFCSTYLRSCFLHLVTRWKTNWYTGLYELYLPKFADVNNNFPFYYLPHIASAWNIIFLSATRPQAQLPTFRSEILPCMCFSVWKSRFQLRKSWAGCFSSRSWMPLNILNFKRWFIGTHSVKRSFSMLEMAVFRRFGAWLSHGVISMTLSPLCLKYMSLRKTRVYLISLSLLNDKSK